MSDLSAMTLLACILLLIVALLGVGIERALNQRDRAQRELGKRLEMDARRREQQEELNRATLRVHREAMLGTPDPDNAGVLNPPLEMKDG